MEKIMVKEEKPTCLYCQKHLYGRAGKKYCNIDCKNNYNAGLRSQFRAKMNAGLPETIKAIKRNYEILIGYDLPETENGKILIEKQELLLQGFDLALCTSAMLTANNKLLRCCMNICWLEDGENYLTIEKRQRHTF